jgi:hypothetical protein
VALEGVGSWDGATTSGVGGSGSRKPSCSHFPLSMYVSGLLVLSAHQAAPRLLYALTTMPLPEARPTADVPWITGWRLFLTFYTAYFRFRTSNKAAVRDSLIVKPPCLASFEPCPKRPLD